MRTEFSNQCVVNYEVKTLEFNHLRLQGASNSLRFTLKMLQCLFETFKFVFTQSMMQNGRISPTGLAKTIT